MERIGTKTAIFQIMQDLDTYIKLHVGDSTPAFLREKIRFLHRNLEPGKTKSTVRGILTFFSRWNMFKIWTKVVDVINFITTDMLGRENLTSTPFIIRDRIISPIDIIAFKDESENTLQIKSE